MTCCVFKAQPNHHFLQEAYPEASTDLWQQGLLVLTSTLFPVLVSWAASCSRPEDLSSNISLPLLLLIPRPKLEQAHGRPLMKVCVPSLRTGALTRAVGASSGELGPLWDQLPPVGDRHLWPYSRQGSSRVGLSTQKELCPPCVSEGHPAEGPIWAE